MNELKHRIQQYGLKQVWIADHVGISRSHLNMMLKGTATMSPEIKEKIEKLLNKYYISKI